MKPSTKKIALLGLFASLALALSFLEAILPPVSSYAPGIKIGLPNIIIIFLLYRYDLKSAAAVSFIRYILTALAFGNAISLLYSITGAALSLAVMYVLKRLNLFSVPVLSVIGALSHNIAQVAVAAFLMNTAELIYYLPVLCLSALISGIFVGLTASLLIKTLKNLDI